MTVLQNRKKKQLIKTVTAIAAGACLVAGILLYCANRGMFLPDWINWNEKTESTDLDGDGKEEKLALEGKHFSVNTDGGAEAALRSGWLVSDYMTADINRDEVPEVVLLIWKRGSYGSSRPFWVRRDERSFSQHVGIYQYRDGELEPVWMSSGLQISVADWSLDGEARLHLEDPDGGETVWRWEHFGLTLVEQTDGDGTGAGAVSESGRTPDSEKDGDDAQKDGDAAQKDRNAAQKDIDAAQTVTMIAVGDNIAHGSVCREAWNGDESAYDFSDMYEYVTPTIRKYDLAAVGQETIFTSDLSRVSSFPEFGTPEAMGTALRGAGFNIICAATNHANDLGADGLSDTLEFWKTYPEITLLGIHGSESKAEEITYLEKNGIRFALFDYTEQLNGHNLAAKDSWKIDCGAERLEGQVRAAEEHADYTVCFLHIGEEYSAEPSEDVKELTGTLIDAGADVLICTHPHVLQTYECVTTENGGCGVVYYSLGNFLSHQTRPDTVLGGAAELTFRKPENGSGNITFVNCADGEDQEADVLYGMEPTVCHFGADGTRVYFLEDYTEELAAKHSINRDGTVFTAASLREEWERVAGFLTPKWNR